MSENKINGGSYRIYCKKNIKKSIKYKEKTKTEKKKTYLSLKKSI